MIARSAYSHSMRVALAIPTRSSGWIPSASRPAAVVLTVSSVCPQVTDAQPPLVGKRNASALGVAATPSQIHTRGNGRHVGGLSEFTCNALDGLARRREAVCGHGE